MESIKKRLVKFAASVTNRLTRLCGLIGLEKILINIQVIKLELFVCLGTFFHLRLERKELLSLAKFFGRGFVLPPFFTYRAILLTPRELVRFKHSTKSKVQKNLCVQTYVEQ